MKHWVFWAGALFLAPSGCGARSVQNDRPGPSGAAIQPLVASAFRIPSFEALGAVIGGVGSVNAWAWLRRRDKSRRR